MSLHQCPPSSAKPSPNPQPTQPKPTSGIAPGANAPKIDWGISHWRRSPLALLSLLLLSPLATGCSIERIAAPNQTSANPAQAAEQTLPGSSAPASAQSSAQGEAPAEPPKPSQQIPQLMSRAASTANGGLSPTAESGSHQGPLRVGNQTEHPLRIAFLAQGQAPAEITAAPPVEPAPEEPAPQASNAPREPFHWDFAPAEGGSDGLLLALPEGDLSLRDGDVIVAFAQDGSQRYWGPYVVGQTSLPHWNGDRNEWQLLVQP